MIMNCENLQNTIKSAIETRRMIQFLCDNFGFRLVLKVPRCSPTTTSVLRADLCFPLASALGTLTPCFYISSLGQNIA